MALKREQRIVEMRGGGEGRLGAVLVVNWGQGDWAIENWED